MDPAKKAVLDYIDLRANAMRERLISWCSISSGTLNLPGVNRMMSVAHDAVRQLGVIPQWHKPAGYSSISPDGTLVTQQLAEFLSARKRDTGKVNVLVGIHLDTVYPANSPFQKVELIDGNKLRGPGVADAKGGAVVLLYALEAIEKSPFAEHIAWELFFNTDEEIGSPGSAEYFDAARKRNDLAILFEPAAPNGALVGQRKGSGNFAVTFRGKSAHAGRDFHLGRNAIHAAAEFVVQVNALNGQFFQATFNVGKIDGGGPTNVVPDLAIVRFNVRLARKADAPAIQNTLFELANVIVEKHEVGVEWHGGIGAMPKELNDPTNALLGVAQDCGKELGLDLSVASSGGASDGNRLAMDGMPVVDTLGVRGGAIHSFDEFMEVDSLAERAKLTALMLIALSEGAGGFSRRM